MEEFVLSLKEKQKNSIDIPTFKLPPSTKYILWL